MTAPDDFIRLTDAGNPVEAGAIRAYLEDNGVQCFIKGEHHSALLGSFGAAMIGYDVMVRHVDRERAAELLVAFRSAEPVAEEAWAEGEPVAAEAPAGAGDVAMLAVTDDSGAAEALAERQSEPGPSPALAALLGFVPSFGFAHFYSGAPGRGLLHAAVEVAGIALFTTAPLLAVCLVVGSAAVDAWGGATRAFARSAERSARAELPPAAVRPRTGDRE